MARLPFDPFESAAQRAADQRSAASQANGNGRVTVSELAALIQGALQEKLPARLQIVGEVSGFKEQTHWYFSLKDAAAVVGCVMWAGAAGRHAYRPDNGQQVLVTGRVEFWGRGGRTQVYVEAIEPIGAGALDLEFKRLCEELRGLGWFAPERKRPVPHFPRRVAVVTSRTGAALQDVLDTMRRRSTAVDVAIVDVRVQGPGAAAEVARALRWLGRVRLRERIDVIVLTRGGGSKEDLWTFNERTVAQAIIECPVPVVAAIGHEVDVTIAELVADERCATPTQAAMRVTPDEAALQEQLDLAWSRLSAAVTRLCRHEGERLRLLARHPMFTDPGAQVEDAATDVQVLRRRMMQAAQARLSVLRARLERADARLAKHRPAAEYAHRASELGRLAALLRGAMDGRLWRETVDPLAARLHLAWCNTVEKTGLEIDAAERALELVGPVSVLRRGYSCTLGADGRAVRSVKDVSPGQTVRTRVLDGTFQSTVEGRPAASDTLAQVATGPLDTSGGWAARRRRRAREAERCKDQLSLFGGADGQGAKE